MDDNEQQQVETYNPKDLDPKIDVSEMPVGTHILVQGAEYILNKDKLLEKVIK